MSEKTLTFVCCLDKTNITLDYMSEHQGVRLNSFNRDELNDDSTAVSTFSIDIKESEFYNRESKNGNLYVQRHITNLKNGHCYILLKFKKSNTADGYYYRNYRSPEGSKTEQEYEKIKIISLAFVYPSNKLVAKNNLIQSFLNKKKSHTDINKEFRGQIYLNSYSVGQGMCSLLHNGKEGVLLDCGAGKPILKPNYKKLSTNKLIIDLNALSQVDMILSHLDSDHHRLLSWDPYILEMVSNIYIPSNTDDLFLKDKLTFQKVIACSRIKIKFANGFLHSYRTQPFSSSKEKNDNALVTHISTEKEEVLAPGDYSYKNIHTDLCPGIAALKNNEYTYVIVPHHGDIESSESILSPSKSILAIAFFSAGTNEKYKHPSTQSMDAHSALMFINVVDNENNDIDKIQFKL
ncbi:MULTISPECIES: hypothetical protein [Citrobacter]|uniref:hypothetical protein n=1 Tax=Citrobacter TaxID=544 RepID=UPI0015E9C135|nr:MULTISPECIES: hypothetical protein [Citrobacter]MBJ8898856.1 hypothetical protein [Citrobacter braakii]MBN4807969.1 hypothetical protein [Citrobacter braakii]MBN4812991.1 hypothetical protein [Citrobacter braakii]MBN4822490.1 hypothetical protein [Citrobacter braakii]MBN4837019.1 hypothetical protein [Citrobacter braakii]